MLSERRWARIHANQRRELEKIITNRATAKRLSRLRNYSNIGSWLPPTSKFEAVLELGCGPGRYVALLGQLGYQVIGADSCGSESFPTWKLIDALPNVTFRGAVRAEALPFADESFDHVACLGALLYFDNPNLALAEIRRVLKPGGRLVVRTVNSKNFYTQFTGKKLDPCSKNLYTERELISLMNREGFEVKETFTHGFWPPILTDYWWYLINTRINNFLQNLLSALTPSKYRVNILLVATRRNGSAE